MSTFRPFRGLRPRPELAARLAAPPYDVIDSQEARVLAAGNPHSFLHVTKPEIDLDPSIDLYDERVYDKAAENFRAFREAGWLLQDERPCFYVYGQQMGAHRQVGIMGCASADDYFADVIRKHELTRPDKERDRTRHVDVIGANAGPVFLTYRATEAIDRLAGKITAGPPACDMRSEDGVRHTLWKVEDGEWIAQAGDAFRRVPVLYIADGHHRAASAARVREWRREQNPGHTGREEYNYFLAVAFPHDQMQILPYNRAVADLAGLTASAFLERAWISFEIADAPSPTPPGPRRFCVYLEGKWRLLTAREGTFPAGDPVRRLDCSILQENLLSPVLKIEDPRRDKRIHFVGGIRGTAELERLVDGGGHAVAFSLHPTSVEDLMAVADAGLVMPPKSTWFEPKLRDGLIVRPLED